jgi:flagellar hook-length control protein FliK
LAVTAAANIVANATATPDTGANVASRAALKNMPADMSTLFASLLAGNAQPAHPIAMPADSKPSQATDAGKNANIIDVDQALLEQLKMLQANDPVANADSKTVAQALPAKPKDTQPQAAIVSANVMQQLLANVTSSSDALKVVGRKATPTATHDRLQLGANEHSDKTAKSDDIAEQLKTLGNAANEAKHLAAPAQTTVAKALQLHIDAANGNSGNDQQSSGDRQQQHSEQQASASLSTDTTKPAEPAQSAPTTAQTTAPQAPHVAAQPAAPSADAVAAPTQTTHIASHPVTASLHVAPQAEAAAMPNLGSLAVNIAAKSKNGEKHFDIRLDPAELGRVDVKLTIDDAGKTQANLSAERPQTLELLQRDRATLERALRDAGLDLAGGGLNFSLKGQDREAGDSTPRGRSLAAIATSASDASQPIISTNHILAADSRLDIRV